MTIIWPHCWSTNSSHSRWHNRGWGVEYSRWHNSGWGVEYSRWLNSGWGVEYIVGDTTAAEEWSIVGDTTVAKVWSIVGDTTVAEEWSSADLLALVSTLRQGLVCSVWVWRTTGVNARLSTLQTTKWSPEGLNDKSASWIPKYWWNIIIIEDKMN